MNVYLDDAGHLTADTDEELHAFAARIGLRLEWYQAHRIHHYDVMSATKRERALRLGAWLVTARESVRIAKRQQLADIRPFSRKEPDERPGRDPQPSSSNERQ